MPDTTTNLEIDVPVPSQSDKTTTVANGFQSFDTVLCDTLTVPLTDGDAPDYTMAEADALGYRYFKFTGSLTGGLNVVVPDNKKEYFVRNATGQDLVIKTSGGTGITVADGASVAVMLYCDGTDVISLAAL